jgi:hypothetical protein
VGSAEPVEGEIDVTHEQALDIGWTTLISGWLAAASGR